MTPWFAQFWLASFAQFGFAPFGLASFGLCAVRALRCSGPAPFLLFSLRAPRLYPRRPALWAIEAERARVTQLIPHERLRLLDRRVEHSVLLPAKRRPDDRVCIHVVFPEPD